jgi:hypothetical protein
MKNRSIAIFASFIFANIAACGMEAELGDEQEIVESENELTARPIHVAVFDHPPTREEIDLELARHERESRGRGRVQLFSIPDQTPRTSPPAISPGQKRVTITAATSDIQSAGTDDAGEAFFRGRWNPSSGLDYSVRFFLNAPNRDDLDRDSWCVFYYLINVPNYSGGATSDAFQYGTIGNTSTDAWHCASIELEDRNHFQQTRTQHLPFNTWVDDAYAPESSAIIRTDATLLSY